MPTILFLTAYPIEDSSCRYRIHQFVPYLEAAGYECTVSAFASKRLFQALKSSGRLSLKCLDTVYSSARRLRELTHLSQFDFIVIHREAFPFFQPSIETWILRRQPNVIFSFDDALYAGHEDVSQLSHPLLYRWKHGREYGEIIRRSRHVIAGNYVLANYARRFNPRTSVMPTVVDCEHYRLRPAYRDNTRTVTIGWMGSRSTALYLYLVEPALRRIADTHGNRVQFLFFGHPAYRLDVPHFRSQPFHLDSELDDLHLLDIGLMPLPDSEWARGKCAFKAIQYMASGVATVASPVGVTTNLIQHNINGLLADSVDEWFQALDRLVRDTDLRAQIVTNARQTIEESYSLKVWAPRFVALFDELRGASGALQPEAAAA